MIYKLKYLVVIVALGIVQLKIEAQTVLYHGGSEEDMANSIFMYDNNFFITGTTRRDHKSPTDYYVLRLNKNGSLRDEFIFGGVHRDVGKHILVNDRGIFVFGKTWDGGFPNNDMLLTRLDFSGKEIWKKYYGGTHNDLGHKFISTRDGGFAMIGHNRTFRNGSDYGDIYLVKADAEGELEWENFFGDRYVDHGFDVVENDQGEFIGVGTLGGFFNPTSTDYANHDADIYIFKTNSSGDELWAKTYGGKSHDWAKEIIAAPGGGYYVCGSTQSEGAGSFDFFLMKIDEEGNQLWMKTYGGSDFDYGESVRISEDQKLYIIGSSASFSDNFKPDHFLVKTDLEGEEIWSKTFGGDGSDYSNSLVCTNDSGCVFTGWTDLGEQGKKDVVLFKIAKDGTEKVVSVIPPVNDSIEQISVFPNPARNSFKVLIDTEINSDFRVAVYNLLGEKVYENTVEPNVVSNHIVQLASGTYIYQVQNKNEVVFRGKLIYY